MSQRLTEQDVADHFQISVSTCQRWRRQGLGPQYMDLGKNTIRYRHEDLLAYEEERTTGGAIPARAIKGLQRARDTLDAIATWKMPDAARTLISGVRGELESLLEVK